MEPYSETVRKWHNIGLRVAAPFAILGWLAVALKTNKWIWGSSVMPGDIFLGLSLILVACAIYGSCRLIAWRIEELRGTTSQPDR